MKKFSILIYFSLFITGNIFCQTLVSTYPFFQTSAYNGFWGITQINDTLRIGSSNNGKIYKVTKTGAIIDSLTTPFNFNNGLAWDGTGFWIARNASGLTSRILKVNSSGAIVDTIRISALNGSSTIGIGGIAIDGIFLWYAIYYPDFTSYPFAYAYKMNLTTRVLADSIPLRGKQVQGITIKGDTIFYVTDNFQGDQERIYAYRKIAGDTLFSFAAPDPDNDCDPRGLFWDGQNLYLMAYSVGANTNRVLYKYAITGQGSPLITVSPSSMNFGNVLIGTTSNQNLTIFNSGSARLIISSFTMTNPRFSITPNIVPDTIQPAASKNYTVGFSPNVYDSTSGELRIINNDLGNPVKIVPLRGKGVFTGAYVSISSQSYNFNNRRVNSLCGFTFDITNQGSQPLVINSVSLSSARFRYDTLNARFPITIDTQKTRTLRIWFNPDAATTFVDSAIFSTNAVNNSTAKIILSGAGADNPTTLGDILWEGNIPDNPCTSSDDFQPKSMKETGDVNGDGKHDLIVATENYWTICYNGNASVNADTLWKFNSCNGTNNTGSVDWEDAMWLMEDITNDGIWEVVIGCGGGNEEVYVLNGVTGRKIWEYPGPGTNYDGDINGLRTDKDFNGDGRKDVLVSASGEGTTNEGRHSIICLNGITGQEIFNTIIPGAFTHDVTTLTTGAAIGFASNGGPYGVKGISNSGAITWSYSTSSTVWSLKQIPDINSDGNTDLVGMFGFSGGTFALSGATGQQLWIGNNGTSNNGTIEYVDDRNRNGSNELVFSGPQTAFRVESNNDSIIWSRYFASSYIRDAGFLGDVTGDSIGEVLFSTQQPGKVFVLNGTDGSILFEYTFGTTISQRADRVNAIQSVDGNQSNEFAACSRDGRIKCFSGGPNGYIGISSNNQNIPINFALYQNYPNPFNPVTNIKFDLPLKVNVHLKIYDLLGREVETLVNGILDAGVHIVDWNSSNYASGVYFYELKAIDPSLRSGQGFTGVKKMVVIK